MHAPGGAAQHVAGVSGDQEREAEPRPDIGAVHAFDAVDVVEAAHEVDADADVRRQPRVRLPRVLDVDADVAVARGGVMELERRLVAAVEGHGAAVRVVRIDLPHFVQAEAVVDQRGW